MSGRIERDAVHVRQRIQHGHERVAIEIHNVEVRGV
jgi:hypothetical protein